MNPANLRYTEGHTWVRTEDGEAVVGITDYAQQQLGSILYVETSEPGDTVRQFAPAGSVESDKSTSDFVSPVSGEVIAVNEEALGAPEKLNEDPYGEGWLLRIRMSDPSEVEDLLTAEEYEERIANA